MNEANELAPVPPGDGLTPQEEAFLRAYSESLDRMAAIEAAGIRGGLTSKIKEEHELLAKARGIIGKAERMSLSSLASTMGKDRIYLISHIARVCEADDVHEAIKGLHLMARIHGLWEKEQGYTRHQVALIFGAPQEKAEPRRANLPFVIEAEYSDDTENE